MLGAGVHLFFTMKATLLVPLLSSLLGVIAVPAHAEKLYVAADAKDGGTGSKARPMKSLQAAVDAAVRANRAPVHTVEIGPGTYSLSHVVLVNAGSATAPLVLRAADPARPPVLDGSALPPVADPKTSAEGLLTVKGGEVTLENLSVVHAPGHGIWIEKAKSVRASRCSLSDIHGHGIRVLLAEEGKVESCQIDGVDGTGIWVTGGDRSTLAPAKMTISQNSISRANRSKGAGSSGNGIFAEGVGITVVHNTITDSIEEPWTMGIRLAGNNHVAEKNRLEHVSFGDAGAIYVGGRNLAARGNVVRFNVIKDCANGVYLDDRASGNEVTGNIISNAKVGIFIGGGQGNSVTKNVVFETGAFFMMDNRGMAWTAHNHPFKADYSRLQAFLAEGSRKTAFLAAYPALAEITAENALQPAGNVVKGNFAEAIGTTFRYTDMDKILAGAHEAKYAEWNSIAAPQLISVPRDRPLNLAPLGAAGLTSDRLGAPAVPASPGR